MHLRVNDTTISGTLEDTVGDYVQFRCTEPQWSMMTVWLPAQLVIHEPPTFTPPVGLSIKNFADLKYQYRHLNTHPDILAYFFKSKLMNVPVYKQRTVYEQMLRGDLSERDLTAYSLYSRHEEMFDGIEMPVL